MRSKRLPLFTLALTVALAEAAVAAPAQLGRHAATGEPEPGEEKIAPDEIKVRAESYEYEPGLTKARGTVEIRLTGMRVLADKADVYEEKQPDGKLKHRFVAEGNVVFVRGEERLSGDRLEMDDDGHGFFYDAVGYVEPGVFVEARKVERVDSDTYRVEGGTFTSCAQPNPRWNFSASRATIDVDDKITARNALFKVKGVPAFYAPYIYYPIRKDGRSTGLLIPHVGYSSIRGVNVGTGFFWAMGRSADQTFYADSYSKLGYGFGHELRYLGTSPSRTRMRTYVFDVTGTDTLDYDLDWNALQMLPGKVRATLNVRKYSDLLFQQQFQESFTQATNRNERWGGALERDFGFAVVSAYADTANTFFGGDYKHVSAHLPFLSLRRFPRSVGWGGVLFGLDGSAGRIRYGNQDREDTWSRYDFAPTVSRPLRISFLELNPSLGYRYTRYGASMDPDQENAIVGPPIDRSFFETSISMVGPTFARVFDTPGFGYSDRFKHTIGPEVTWTYRTRVEDFNLIPKFDGQDYFPGTDEINYALVQRFFAKRRDGATKPMPFEFFSWRLMQTYYVQISEGQKNYDPNYSSSAFGPGFVPAHLGPIASRMRLKPTRDYALDYSLEYDVNFKQLRRMGLSGNVTRPGFALQGSWSRSLRVSENPEERVVGGETLRGSAALDLLPKRLSLQGSADYDLLNNTLWQMRGQLRYSVQCCGFTVEHIRYNWNNRIEQQWRFTLELANVGSIGSFMGADPMGGSQRFGGYP